MNARRLALLLALGALLLPASALAEQFKIPVLDLTSGAPAKYYGVIMGIARDAFLFSFVLGLALEAFSSAPSAPRDYAGVVQRAVIVLALLVFFPTIFGTVIRSTDGLATQLTPPDVWEKFWQASANYLQANYDGSKDPSVAQVQGAEAEPGFLDSVANAAKYAGRLAGGGIFNAFLTMAMLICQGLHWVIGTLAHVLIALLYVVGPLALVGSIPKASGVGGRWFLTFVTIAFWPVISALLLAITSELGLQAFLAQGAFGSLASAMLIAATAVATPSIASALIGGGVKDIITPGLHSMSHGTQMASNAVNTLKDDARRVLGKEDEAPPARSPSPNPPVNPPR